VEESYLASLEKADLIEEALTKFVNSHDSLVLKGNVMVENSKEKLAFSLIELKNNKLKTYSDMEGSFTLISENYKSLKFPDTLMISYTGFDSNIMLVNSIGELKKLFDYSDSISSNQIKSDDISEENKNTFWLKEPSDGYVEVVPSPNLRYKIKRKLETWFVRKNKYKRLEVDND